MHETLEITQRTTVKRKRERASYDKLAIYNVIDNAMMGIIAFDDGTSTHAIPTAIWRNADYVYIHGSNGSRLIKCLQTGKEVCMAIVNLHGLVLARSALHHSMNYSSVCIYGVFEEVESGMKATHLKQFMEHWMPDRWQYVRQPDQQELAATTIMRIAINEAVMKSRQGSPNDAESDMQQAIWAGILPMKFQWQIPQQDKEQDNANLPGLCFREW